jgi:hypothetical protein
MGNEPHLGNGTGGLVRPRALGVIREAITVTAALRRTLVRCDAQVLLAFQAHRFVDLDADQLRQGVEALLRPSPHRPRHLPALSLPSHEGWVHVERESNERAGG